MELEDYWIKRDGFYEKELHESRMLRWAVTPIIAAWTDKFDAFRDMPLPGDDSLKKDVEADRKRKAQHIDARNLETLRKFRENERTTV